MHHLSVIIPVFNGIGFTQKCLPVLKDRISKIKNEKYKVTFVIVDDGSTDGTSQWVEEHYPEVYLLKGNGNLWWSGGINKGITFALDELLSDYILWWNNDILPHENYFVNLFDILKRQSVNVIVGSKVFVLNKDIIWGMGGKFDAFSGSRFMYGERSADTERYLRPFEVDWFPGMGTVFHRSVFEKIGLLDEKLFPQYHGDSDFTYRAKKAGFTLIAFPDLVIYNDNTNTGIKHNGSIKYLYRSLTSIKSNYNVSKDIAFFRKHSQSVKAYVPLAGKYVRYIGGFLKWSLLGVMGVKRKTG